MLYATPDFQPIDENQSYTAPDGTQYPATFPKADIPGLHAVTETERPTDPALVVTGFTINENYEQVWQTRSKTSEEIQAELIPFAYAQISRTTQPITLTISGYSRTFTPTDEFNSRLNNKYQTMKVANIASTRWIFDNGGADITTSDMEAMALAANNQWQPYFDTIESVIGQIMAGTITTTAQIEAAFDAAYSES